MGNKIFRMGKLFSSTDIDGTIEHVGGTATQAYTKGSYFVGDDGYFYAVDDDIDQGDTITLNTNCHRSSIASELANANGGIRYIEDDDVVQLYYDGSWRDWKSGGMAYPVGTEVEFIYKGIIDEFVIPATGNWKIEAYGAAGGSGYRNYDGGSATLNGGKGGYAVGTKRFEADDVLYVCVGSAGQRNGTAGYNGGGAGYTVGGGGGASHVSTTKTLLQNTVSTEVLIVGAGGGGAGGVDNWLGLSPSGGAGGGYSGGGGGSVSDGSLVGYGGGGGSQSAGGSAGGGSYSSGSAGGFGYGGAGRGPRGGGGGAGWYGGGSGGSLRNWGDGAAGGGGSSYIKNTLSDANTIAGQRSGDGYVKFTYMGR